MSLAATANYRKTKKGLVTNLYHKMKGRNEVLFSLQALHDFSCCLKFDRLYVEWVESGYDKAKKPSIDRINRSKPYDVGNIQWLTWAENRYKQSMERRNRSPKVAQILLGVTIKIHASQRAAIKAVGASQGNMSACLNGRRKTCKGFEWKYIYQNPELLNL